MRQARSQLGSREAVASMAKTSRPRPEAARTGRFSILRRNASTSADLPAAGSLSRELVMGGRAPRSCGLYGAAAPAESSPASAHDSASRLTEGCPSTAFALNKLSRFRTPTRALVPRFLPYNPSICRRIRLRRHHARPAIGAFRPAVAGRDPAHYRRGAGIARHARHLAAVAVGLGGGGNR